VEHTAIKEHKDPYDKTTKEVQTFDKDPLTDKENESKILCDIPSPKIKHLTKN